MDVRHLVALSTADGERRLTDPLQTFALSSKLLEREGRMAQRFDIVFDSMFPSRLAAFWASVLAGYEVRPYDQDEVARLAELGLTPETDPTVAADGPGPTLWFQRSNQPTTGRNRIHIDLRGIPRAGEVERLLVLGATVRDEHDDHTVMLDPEGNQFCVFD